MDEWTKVDLQAAAISRHRQPTHICYVAEKFASHHQPKYIPTTLNIIDLSI